MVRRGADLNNDGAARSGSIAGVRRPAGVPGAGTARCGHASQAGSRLVASFFSASHLYLLDLFMRSPMDSVAAPRCWVGAGPFSASFVGSDRPSFRIRRVRPRRCVPVQFT